MYLCVIGIMHVPQKPSRSLVGLAGQDIFYVQQWRQESSCWVGHFSRLHWLIRMVLVRMLLLT